VPLAAIRATISAVNEASPGIAARVTRLVEALAPGGAGIVPEAVRRIGAWIDLVAAWNRRIDLTAARSEDELCDLMLADALVLAPRLPQGGRVVDVGSGAGAPGLPVAILRPDLRVSLVEPLQKRVAFLRTAIGSVLPAGPRPEVVRARGEDVAARGRERFAVAVSRATMAPSSWLSLGAELAPAGEVWVLLAREAPPSLDGWAAADDVRYAWPLTGAERRAVRYVPG
jgi:16S rRNA (guanine527-N7)-methyltransferase